MDQLAMSLLIPFIVLVIFGTMTDRIAIFLEQVMHAIPFFPDKLEKKTAFVLLVMIGFGICWQFDFNLFAYLNHPGRSEYAGYAFTAILISGGSKYLKENFENMDTLPGILSGITTSVTKYFRRPKEKNDLMDQPNDLQQP
jgi:hypothetical protein